MRIVLFAAVVLLCSRLDLVESASEECVELVANISECPVFKFAEKNDLSLTVDEDFEVKAQDGGDVNVEAFDKIMAQEFDQKCCDFLAKMNESRCFCQEDVVAALQSDMEDELLAFTIFTAARPITGCGGPIWAAVDSDDCLPLGPMSDQIDLGAQEGDCRKLQDVLRDPREVKDPISLLEEAIDAADILSDIEALKGFTLLAPTDSAFINFASSQGITVSDLLGDEEMLEMLLKKHLIPDALLLSEDVLEPSKFASLEGSELNFDKLSTGGVSVQGTPINQADIETCKGVMHVIPVVLADSVDIEPTTRDAVVVVSKTNQKPEDADEEDNADEKDEEGEQEDEDEAPPKTPLEESEEDDDEEEEPEKTPLKESDEDEAEEEEEEEEPAAKTALKVSEDDEAEDACEEGENIVQVLTSFEEAFGMLVEEIEEVDSVKELLEGEGPITIFAPINSAIEIEKIVNGERTEEDIVKTLERLIVVGDIAGSDLEPDSILVTIGGDELKPTVDDGTVSVNGVKVRQADIQACNGRIHIVDAALPLLSDVEDTEEDTGAPGSPGRNGASGTPGSPGASADSADETETDEEDSIPGGSRGRAGAPGAPGGSSSMDVDEAEIEEEDDADTAGTPGAVGGRGGVEGAPGAPGGSDADEEDMEADEVETPLTPVVKEEPEDKTPLKKPKTPKKKGDRIKKMPAMPVKTEKEDEDEDEVKTPLKDEEPIEGGSCDCSASGLTAGMDTGRQGCAQHVLEFGNNTLFCYIEDPEACMESDQAVDVVPSIKFAPGAWRECSKKEVTEFPSLAELLSEDIEPLDPVWRLFVDAGLSELLEEEGPFTVFVPSRLAVARGIASTLIDGTSPDTKELKKLMENHVAKGEFSARDLRLMKTVTTIGGAKLGVRTDEDGGILLGKDASVQLSNMYASNGVAHLVDDLIATGVLKERVTPVKEACSCSTDGISGGVDTGRPGCDTHIPGEAAFCYVKHPEECHLATDSEAFEGAKWLTCPDPCSCSKDGFSGDVDTSRPGCARHVIGSAPFCYVLDPSVCKHATASEAFEGASWKWCNAFPRLPFLSLGRRGGTSDDPCACSEDGVSGGVYTGRSGCGRFGVLFAPFKICYVSEPSRCPISLPSFRDPGAAWRVC
ncbi:hypothetical protein BSKO_07902 [Bryopsis sp. KO-2023]|nr:hypothetical protein BSKO_07902 [Bryopsis sp. KO-2023]